ncbi:nucleotide exchange factor GrpE [Candidatus Roizmanbacteria bacterium]|nr:nucleotide exchange factor GrpE [Candidatus Roizmanbacteria bacterium]
MNSKKDSKKTTMHNGMEIKRLREELEKTKKDSEDYKNKYLRALADYQNYEKRVSDEKIQTGQIATTGLLLKLLPFLDHLEKAEVFIKDQGLKMIKDKFYEMLHDIGLEEIQVLGKPFDPHLAEAIEVIEGKDENIVKEILRKGYRYNEKVLRVAQVKVTKKKIVNS